MKINLLFGILLALAPVVVSSAEAAPAPVVNSIFLPQITGGVCAPVVAGPDVLLERLDDEGVLVETTDAQIVDDGARQTLSAVVAPGHTQNYVVHIKNNGQSATTFQVSLEGSPTPKGDNRPWAPKGWTAIATSDEQGRDILVPLKLGRWETPRIAMGEETLIRLSLNAPNTTETPITDGSFRIVASNGTQSDAVIGRVGPQFISKIQWTLDGDDTHENRWHDVNEKTMVQITRYTALGVRALKSVPSAPWGNDEVLGPTWILQGHSVEGEEVWLEPQNPALLGATVTATLGNSLSFQVRVLPDAYVTLTVDHSHAVLTANATQTQPRVVTAKVEDEEDNPLPHTRVRLRAFNGKNVVTSFWKTNAQEKATRSNELIAVTNEQGEIEVEWAIGADVAPKGGKVTLQAEVVDEAGTPFGEDDDFNMTIEAEGVG